MTSMVAVAMPRIVARLISCICSTGTSPRGRKAPGEELPGATQPMGSSLVAPCDNQYCRGDSFSHLTTFSSFLRILL